MTAAHVLQALMTTIDRREWDGLDTFLHPDFVCEYVHTGERFGREEWVRLNAEYPGFDRLEVRQLVGDVATAACRSHVTAQGDAAMLHFECATFVDVSHGLITSMVEVWTDCSHAVPLQARPAT